MNGRAAPLQALELLTVLHEYRVEFIVIGGFAVAAHGFVRATKDLDVFPAPGRPNLARLHEALRSIHARPAELEGLRPSERPVDWDLEGLLGGGNWILGTCLGRVDVMQFIDGYEDYDRLRAGAIARAIPGLDFAPLFVGYDDLIGMKQSAGRDQDLLDIAALERARRSAGPE